MEQTSLLALLQAAASRSITTDFRAELARARNMRTLMHSRRHGTPRLPWRSPGAQAVGADTGARSSSIYENAPHGLVVTHPRQFEADLVDFIKA